MTGQRGKRISNDVDGSRSVVWSKQNRTISRVESVPLSDRDVDDIVAFLKSLSSESLVARSRPGVF